MKQFIVRLVVVVVLALALLMGVTAGRVHALVACQPLVHFPCTGGGVVCVDKHGHIRHWHGHVHPGWHCIAI